MQYTPPETTGMKVSRSCSGTMNFGEYADERDSFRILDCALESGINFFDTADACGSMRGETENMIGPGNEAPQTYTRKPRPE